MLDEEQRRDHLGVEEDGAAVPARHLGQIPTDQLGEPMVEAGLVPCRTLFTHVIVATLVSTFGLAQDAAIPSVNELATLMLRADCALHGHHLAARTGQLSDR